MKKFMALWMVIIAFGTLSACSGDNTTDGSDNGNTEEPSEEELREFTLEELAEFDGKDGKDAYVAVDGDVYDMTDSSYWNEGNHQDSVQAGQDLTHEIDMDSPHGRDALDNVPKIGILVESSESTD
ncbi:MAG: cytochrome b5 domain-containing protein [Bacillota bacterium]